MFAAITQLNSSRRATPQHNAGINRLCIRNLEIYNKNCYENKTSQSLQPNKGSFRTYRALSLFVLLPTIIVMSGVQWIAHQSKDAEHKQRPEFVPYPYLRIRTRRYPWGDGNKTLFHNPKVNALPDGYEED